MPRRSPVTDLTQALLGGGPSVTRGTRQRNGKTRAARVIQDADSPGDRKRCQANALHSQRQLKAQTQAAEAVTADGTETQEFPPEEELVDDFFYAFSQAPRPLRPSASASPRPDDGDEEDEVALAHGASHTQRSQRPMMTLVSTHADDEEAEDESASPLRSEDGGSGEYGSFIDVDADGEDEGDAFQKRPVEGPSRNRTDTTARPPLSLSPPPPFPAIRTETSPTSAHVKRGAHHSPEEEADTDLSRAMAQWPRLCPGGMAPARRAAAAEGVGCISFHSRRYGEFVRVYCGLTTDAEVAEAERRARSISVIGIARPARRMVHMGQARRCTVTAQRSFLRHSVLAVEGDGMFAEMIQHAEALYKAQLLQAQETSDALRELYKRERAKREGMCGAEVKLEADCDHDVEGDAQQRGKVFKTEPVQAGSSSVSSPHRAVTNSENKEEEEEEANADCSTRVRSPTNPRRSTRALDPFLRPNARCIALHYGLPASATKGSPSAASSAAPPYHKRVSLMAIISSTRIEEKEDIYVSLESYHRCLDEVAWHRARYGGTKENKDSLTEADAENNVLLHGDVYTGVKHFARWPKGLNYYHGVGRRHSDGDVATAGFPFTLLNLTLAPELGERELGLVAARPIPYGTCFLYTGPSISTKKVEKLVEENFSKEGEDGDTSSSSSNDSDGSEGEEADETVSNGKGNMATKRKKKQPASGAKRANTRRNQKNTTPNRAHQLACPLSPDNADIDFTIDDTYALGLGRHGVCFGQGVARYMNHRYNLSRFGNAELCSLMLSMPSEFATAPLERLVGAKRRNRKAASGDSGRAARKAPRRSDLKSPQPPMSSASAQRTRGSSPLTRPNSPNNNNDGTGQTDQGESAASAPPPPPSRKRRTVTRTQTVFFEDQSQLVTVPFFIASTDIAPGTPLLAWTYGEEYDAKLERVAVADGAVVPYADAALLNARPLMNAGGLPISGSPLAVPQRRWQRYGGDYRFALGVGDIVWRRRPLPASTLTVATPDLKGQEACCRDGGPLVQLATTLPGYVRCRCGVCDRVCPPAAHDIFVVVQLMQHSMEHVLLLPLEALVLPEKDLHALLKSQSLTSYISPFAPPAELARCALRAPTAKETTSCQQPTYVTSHTINIVKQKAKEEEEEDEIAVILGARLYSRTSSARNSTTPSANTTPVPNRRRKPADREHRDDDRDDGVGVRRESVQGGNGVVRHSCHQNKSLQVDDRVRTSDSVPKRPLSEEWVVYDTNTAQLRLFTNPDQLMRRCIVASTDSLGLLLPDIDYVTVRGAAAARRALEAAAAVDSLVREDRNTASMGNTPQSPSSPASPASLTRRSGGQAASGGNGSNRGGASRSFDARLIVMNLDDLRQSTSLVLNSHRACRVPPVMNGLLWPLVRRQSGALGCSWMYTTEKHLALQ